MRTAVFASRFVPPETVKLTDALSPAASAAEAVAATVQIAKPDTSRPMRATVARRSAGSSGASTSG
jgi:hypothetical protein